MTDAEFFEFIIVIMELVAFITYLLAGAVVLEVIVPKLMNIAVRISVWLKNHKFGRRIRNHVKA